MTKYIVFTDMDGTLLDHDTYRWDAAKPTLEQLKSKQIPVICNTSKTYAEVSQYQEAIGFNAPFIVENGAAIHACSNQKTAPVLMHKFGADRKEILSHLSRIRNLGFKFTGFNDWTIEEIANDTGLPYEQAKQAANRQYSEPLIWQDTEAKKISFLAELKQHNLCALQGGRYLSVQGFYDKGKALLWLKDYYQTQWQSDVKTIALGDSGNDVAMLEVADISVWIKSNKPFPKLTKTKQVYYSNLLGPKGWNEIMEQLLQ